MNVQPKDDDDTMMGMRDPEVKGKNGQQGMNYAGIKKQQINANVDWKEYLEYYESIPREKLAAAISGILLQVKSRVDENTIKMFSDQSGRDNFIRTATLQVMSTPEYQLC
jgi:hypothetical protein